MKTIFSGAMRAGKGTVFVVGLSVILAAVMSVASMALAANGKPFILGKNNVATAITTLTKQGPGSALRLLVRPGQPPMAVNSQIKVANLNADKLDGQDAGAFLPVGGKAADSDLLDGQDASAFLGAGATATNADKLDGKDIGELPGSVVQTVAIVGDISTAPPFGTLGFYGPTAEVTTSSTQRLVGVVSAPLKVVESTNTGNSLGFTYGLCYRKAGTTNPLVLFYGGSNTARGTATTTPVSWTAAQTRAPGSADTWEVGFCARNGENNLQTLSGAGSVSGWIEVVNPTS